MTDAENKLREQVLTEKLIKEKCAELAEMLIEKNHKYGNSALEPIRIFSHASATEQLLVRLDDKLSRIRNRANDEDEDVLMDTAGYLVLLMIARQGEAPKKEDIE